MLGGGEKSFMQKGLAKMILRISILTSFVVVLSVNAQTNSGFMFPFDTSARWEYNIVSSFDPLHPSHITLRLLNDTIMPNGRAYKPFSDGSRAIFYFRKDSSRLYQYWRLDSTEFIRYDFSKLVGDTLSKTFKSPDGFVILIQNQMESVFGNSRKVMSFQSSDALVWDEVVDTIGILNFNPGGTDITYQLTGASVHGYAYGVLTYVSDKLDIFPRNPSLLQNYPNPFNPSTTFTFILPLRSRSVLTIYNILGSTVTKLLENELDAGIHSIRWDASGYASGVYFYTLEAGNIRLAKSMLLLK
jgi:hypothetical protein